MYPFKSKTDWIEEFQKDCLILFTCPLCFSFHVFLKQLEKEKYRKIFQISQMPVAKKLVNKKIKLAYAVFIIHVSLSVADFPATG